MSALYFFSAIIGLILFLNHLTDSKLNLIFKNHYFIIIFFGLVIRILLTNFDIGYENDINNFKFWADILFRDGFSKFYGNEYFTNYPPGYMYILYVIGGIKNIFDISADSSLYTFLIKLPAILADIITGIFIYKLAFGKMKSTNALVISIAYVLNPAILINSAVWGQVDSIYTLVIFISIYCLTSDLLLKAFVSFAIATLIKPQSLIFSPLYIFYLYDFLKVNKFDKKAVEYILKSGLICMLFLLIGIVPFVEKFNISAVILQYAKTLASYPYASVNAYNFYTVIGANLTSIDKTFIFMPYSLWGTLAIISIVAISFAMLKHFKSKSSYFFTAAFINFATYMFSVKMHERYLFPSLLLFLIAYIYKSEKSFLFAFSGLSLSLFLNCADVLYYVNSGGDYSLISESALIVSMLNLALFAYTVVIFFQKYKSGQIEKEIIYNNPVKALFDEKVFKLETPEATVKLIRKDYIYMLGITFIYAIVAFYNLGDRKAPENPWLANANEYVIVDFGEEKTLSRFQTYFGHKNNKKYLLQFSDDEKNWRNDYEFELISVFAWKDFSISETARFVKISSLSNESSMIEMAFRDENNEIIPINMVSELFDEQILVPESYSHMNSTIFDEVYHARTAYEYINKLDVYENTHPPLGKVIISLGIMIFGMNPFGWRFMGTMFGIFMLPLIYIFAKKIFRSSFWAIFATLIFALDCMHFAQTRIATIDSYVTFFIMAMYYFMYEYYNLSFYKTKFFKTLIPLFFSGMFMGLAIASKWQGVYATIGLAIIFFCILFKRYLEYVYNKREAFFKYALLTILSCFVFFIFVPCVIYSLSYYQYLQTPGQEGLKSIMENQKQMFSYHAFLVSEHPASSKWWSWPLMLEPILYYINGIGNKTARIFTIGNPAIWWCGIIAFFYAIRNISQKFSKISFFLLIAFLSQYLPWVFISRTTYIYHFFPSVPFIILLITFMFKNFIVKKNKNYVYIYIIIVFSIFLAIYPLLSGIYL